MKRNRKLWAVSVITVAVVVGLVVLGGLILLPGCGGGGEAASVAPNPPPEPEPPEPEYPLVGTWSLGAKTRDLYGQREAPSPYHYNVGFFADKTFWRTITSPSEGANDSLPWTRTDSGRWTRYGNERVVLNSTDGGQTTLNWRSSSELYCYWTNPRSGWSWWLWFHRAGGAVKDPILGIWIASGVSYSLAGDRSNPYSPGVGEVGKVSGYAIFYPNNSWEGKATVEYKREDRNVIGGVRNVIAALWNNSGRWAKNGGDYTLTASGETAEWTIQLVGSEFHTVASDWLDYPVWIWFEQTSERVGPGRP